MKLFDPVKLAARNLTRRKLRSFLTSFAVFIGVALLTVMISLGLGVRKWMVDQITGQVEYTRITVTPKGSLGMGSSLLTSGSGSLSSDSQEEEIKIIDDETVKEIGDINHVTQVQPMLMMVAQKLRIEGQEQFLKTAIGAGFDIIENDAYNKKTLSGSLAGWYEKPDNILLTNRTLENYKLTVDDVIGKTVQLSFPKTLGGLQNFTQTKAEEFSYEFNLAGVIDVGSDQANFLIPVNAAAEIQALRLNMDNTDEYIKNAGYPFLYVNTDDLNNTPEVAQKISDLGYQATTVEDLIGMINRIFFVVQGVLAVFGLIALGIAALGIINTMVMAIYERTKEIGILKAIGATKSDIRKIFMAEAGMIGFFGGIFGTAGGFLFNFLANKGLNVYLTSQGEDPQNLFSFPLWLICGSIVFAVILGVLAGLYPAERAAKLDPIEALRHE